MGVSRFRNAVRLCLVLCAGTQLCAVRLLEKNEARKGEVGEGYSMGEVWEEVGSWRWSLEWEVEDSHSRVLYEARACEDCLRAAQVLCAEVRPVGVG